MCMVDSTEYELVIPFECLHLLSFIPQKYLKYCSGLDVFLLWLWVRIQLHEPVEVQLLCKFVGLEARSKLNRVPSNVRHNGLEKGPCPKQS